MVIQRREKDRSGVPSVQFNLSRNIFVTFSHSCLLEKQVLNLVVYFLPSAPGPVSDFRVTSVSTTAIGLAWSSNDSDFFKIITTKNGTGESQENTTTHQSIVIGGLSPGTMYVFDIFPIGPNETEGDPQRVCSSTGKQIDYVFCRTVP